MWIAGLVTTAVLAIVATTWVAVSALTAGSVLDARAVERGVHHILVEEYGLSAPETIRCPSDKPVQVGTGFDCTVTSSIGLDKTVRVQITSPAGDYLVGKPG